MIRKIIISTLFACIAFVGLHQQTTHAVAPRFEQNFADYLTQKKWWNSYGNESFWDLSRIGFKSWVPLQENIKHIFYPDTTGQWWAIWDLIKVLGFVVFVVMIIRQWFQYALNADNTDKIKDLHVNFAWIFLWWLIFFLTTWVLWIGLWISWTTWWSETLVNNLDKNIIFQIFAGIRAGMFFMAIVLLGYTWWKVIVGIDDEERIKVAKNWVLNIVVALIVVKIIDYMYFIAQSPDFKNQASTLLVEVSKVLWYILWWFFTIMLIYYGFRLMFSGGNDEHLKKVKNIIIGVFLGSLVIFMFFLIIYQITQEFA